MYKKLILMSSSFLLASCDGAYLNGPTLYSLQSLVSSDSTLPDKAVALGATAATFAGGLLTHCPDLQNAGLWIQTYTGQIALDPSLYATESGVVLTREMMTSALSQLGQAALGQAPDSTNKICAVIKEQTLVLAKHVHDNPLAVKQ